MDLGRKGDEDELPKPERMQVIMHHRSTADITRLGLKIWLIRSWSCGKDRRMMRWNIYVCLRTKGTLMAHQGKPANTNKSAPRLGMISKLHVDEWKTC